MSKTITVHGAHGQIKVDPLTGKPVEYIDIGIDGYSTRGITRFDIASFVNRFNHLAGNIDILELGYHYKGKDGVEQFQEPAFTPMMPAQEDFEPSGSGDDIQEWADEVQDEADADLPEERDE